MGATGIWRANASILMMLILVNLALNLAGDALWIAAGALALAAGMAAAFRQGMGLGHGACGIRGTVESALKAGEKVYAQLDRKYIEQAWSVSAGLKGLLLSALIPYAAGGIYVALSLMSQNIAVPCGALIASRAAAWLLSLPYWPLILHWHDDFVTLTPTIAGMLLISPFALPLCTFAGYMQGPRLWRRSEEAMMQGRRRAKARARVGKKLAPKIQKPEI